MKFKIGDWVDYNGKIFEICDSFKDENGEIKYTLIKFLSDETVGYHNILESDLILTEKGGIK